VFIYEDGKNYKMEKIAADKFSAIVLPTCKKICRFIFLLLILTAMNTHSRT
jgi:hypothetical protein